ncbi:MAG: hypothetical protein ACE5KW_06430, partial [Dehalococcoidia bacterium]
MLRPLSAAPVTVYFDAVTFGETGPSSNQPVVGGAAARPESGPPAVEDAHGAQRTPVSLANLGSSAERPLQSEDQGGGANLALVLGLSVASGLTGLVVIWKARGWWRSRAGGRSP